MQSSTVLWSLISYFLIGLAYFAVMVFVLGMLEQADRLSAHAYALAARSQPRRPPPKAARCCACWAM